MTKVWLDENDNKLTDKIKLPESLSITLVGNDGSQHGLKLTQDGDWTDTIELFKVSTAGEAINYTLTEQELKGYKQVSLSGTQATGFVLTNKQTTDAVEETPVVEDEQPVYLIHFNLGDTVE